MSDLIDARRAKFEAAVIARMKESGFLEVEIRVECLSRGRDGYHDGSIAAYWDFWNAALDSAVVGLPQLNAAMFNADVVFGHEKARAEAADAIHAAGVPTK